MKLETADAGGASPYAAEAPRGPAAWAVIATLACGGFLATFDLNAVGAIGTILLCLPYPMLEPIVDWLSA